MGGKYNGTRAIQHQHCGQKGHLVTLENDFSDANNLAFSVAWIKYKYGVFAEHSQPENSNMYPEFYRRSAAEIWPNSCANAKIKGIFTETCAQHGNCSFESQQNQVVSSLLYTQDKSLFPKVNKTAPINLGLEKYLFSPQISKLCNETSHDKLSPTQQNLICGGKSAMEVIKMQVGNSRQRLEPPEITFVQPNNNDGLVIILDNGPQMTAENWSVLRRGLEQMMLIMPKTRKLAAIIGQNYYGPRVIDSGNNDRFWETVIFPPNLDTSNQALSSNLLSLKFNFQALMDIITALL